MLTLHTVVDDTATPITIGRGAMIGIGFVIPADTDPFTRARVLVVGDLLRRVLEDIHSAQVLAAVITDDTTATDSLYGAGLMVRPPIGVFSSREAAESFLGRSLDVLVTVTGCDIEPWTRPERSGHGAAAERNGEGLGPYRDRTRLPTMAVAPVRMIAAVGEPDPEALRLALVQVPYSREIEMSGSMLEQAHAVVLRWRERLGLWSHHPSRPIPARWRAAALAALDDDLDVAGVVAMMAELEGDEAISPGAKFEAFAFFDRVLAVDLARDLGRKRPRV